MHKSKWIVFNQQGEKVKTVTLNHKSNLVYIEIDQFEKELLEQGLSAHRKESFERFKGKDIPFKLQLKYLGWKL